MLLVVGLAAVVTRPDGDTRVTTEGAGFPLTLDGHRDWQVALMNGEIQLSGEEFIKRFAPNFVVEVPFSTFIRTAKELQSKAPWRVLAEVERRGDEVLAVQLVAADGTQARFTIHLYELGKVDSSTILIARPCAGELAVAGTALPPSIAGQWEWARDILTTNRAVTDEEVRDHLSPSFIRQMGPEEFRMQVAQLRRIGPFTVRSFEGRPSPVLLRARVGVSTGEEARLELAVELPAPHRVVGLTVLTQTPCEMPEP
ncbi:MAG TPA: Cpe/LpqF family protein [Acidimicrobiales bacterium]|nr:Cpe/LpqF family protein [Acidimicrobiales bacterium]